GVLTTAEVTLLFIVAGRRCFVVDNLFQALEGRLQRQFFIRKPAHNWEEWDRSQYYRFRFKELAIVKMIRVIEENQCGVFFR
ncbi:hypothetical protein, partial [Pantoea agglomerans]|uniref:hypothetical protein n=1 Tax=Enterobacter agglomerans TaxID=549 RepID=UPI001A8DAF78